MLLWYPYECCLSQHMNELHMGDKQPRIRIPNDRLADFCRRHHIRRLSLFGSALRDDFGPNSDIDVLVEFETGKTPSFLYFARWFADGLIVHPKARGLIMVIVVGNGAEEPCRS